MALSHTFRYINTLINALKTMGIPETIAVETKKFGAKQPIVPNNSEENRAKNRRVEIRILTE